MEVSGKKTKEKIDVFLLKSNRIVVFRDDDDREDDNQGWLRYFLQHPRTASQVICTRKVNGK